MTGLLRSGVSSVITAAAALLCVFVATDTKLFNEVPLSQHILVGIFRLIQSLIYLTFDKSFLTFSCSLDWFLKKAGKIQTNDNTYRLKCHCLPNIGEGWTRWKPDQRCCWIGHMMSSGNASPLLIYQFIIDLFVLNQNVNNESALVCQLNDDWTLVLTSASRMSCCNLDICLGITPWLKVTLPPALPVSVMRGEMLVTKHVPQSHNTDRT